MRIMLLKATLIAKTTHAQGDVVECDDQRAKYLVRHGIALEVRATGGRHAPAPGDDAEGEGPGKREAATKPKARKAAIDV